MDGAARIPVDAARRMFRTQTKKTRGLRREDLARILETFAVYVPGVAYERQWAHAVGVGIGAGYMVFARFGDLRKTCFGEEVVCWRTNTSPSTSGPQERAARGGMGDRRAAGKLPGRWRVRPFA